MKESEALQKQKRINRRNNIIVIILLLALIGVGTLFFLQRRENNVVIAELNVEKDSIKQELNKLIVGYDSIQTENDTIKVQLDSAQLRVQDLLQEIDRNKRISYSNIRKYQKQVKTLRGIMRNFVVQIDSLNQRNQELMAENLEVKKEYKKVENINKELTKEKKKLEENLVKASKLTLSQLMADPLNRRDRETSTARRAEKIRVYFIINENITAKRGQKNIYVRIMRPNQLLMLKNSNNTFKFEDLEIPYSAMREIVYEGKQLPVAIYWDNRGEEDFMKGEYVVDVFADGNNIGTTTFTLK
ncbi:MAG: hypothetical protein CR987_01105 [Draconibacterium sp.]|nr:MAG: hypothetical protein CR987_01105 [Draconibacterium sp.]